MSVSLLHLSSLMLTSLSQSLSFVSHVLCLPAFLVKCFYFTCACPSVCVCLCLRVSICVYLSPSVSLLLSLSLSLSLSQFLFFLPCLRLSGTKKQPKEQVLGPDISRTSTRISRWTSGGKSCFGQALEILENEHLGADIRDPKARTSTTSGGFKKLRSERFGLNFRSLVSVSDYSVLSVCDSVSLFLFLSCPCEEQEAQGRMEW